MDCCTWGLFDYLLLFCGILAAFAKIYAVSTCGRYKITAPLNHLQIVITGASSGIGLSCTEELARNGATIHMVCRDMQKANRVAEQIRKSTSNDRVFVWECDLSILQSVRDFAAKFLAAGHKINLLINNAGIAVVRNRTETVDGLELTMATNHFGHFLLTNLLLERIKESSPCRIVVVSSIVQRLCNLDIEDLQLCKSYNGFKSYFVSKLANILFTRELSKRLVGTGVTVNCIHPGAVQTDLTRELPSFLQPFLVFPFFFFKSAKEGAESVLFAGLSPEIENISGEYLWDNNRATVNSQALDEKLALQLWQKSVELTQLSL